MKICCSIVHCLNLTREHLLDFIMSFGYLPVQRTDIYLYSVQISECTPGRALEERVDRFGTVVIFHVRHR
jgi:hypothetical protein